MGEIQVDLEKSNRRMLARIVQELEAKQVWQVPLALLWTCEECQNRNVPRNRHCGSREAPNEKKNKPAKEQWKFVVDPTSEPSWSDVALYEKDLHRKNARSIMTPQPNMSTTSEASTTRWKRSQSRRAKKRWRRRTLTCTWSQSIQRSVCDVGKEMVMRMQIKIALLLFLERMHNHARCHHGRCHHGRCASPQAAARRRRLGGVRPPNLFTLPIEVQNMVRGRT